MNDEICMACGVPLGDLDHEANQCQNCGEPIDNAGDEQWSFDDEADMYDDLDDTDVQGEMMDIAWDLMPESFADNGPE